MKTHAFAITLLVLIGTMPILKAQEPAPAQAPAPEAARERYALIVGANLGGRGTEPLRFAQKDAEKMADLFRSLGRIPEQNVVVLLAPEADGLRNALAQMRTRVAQSMDRRTELFLYYSGHADDTGLRLGAEVFPMAELRTFLSESPAGVTIAILDACHSGAVLRDKGGKRVPLLDLSPAAEGDASGFAVITSSSAGEKSQESDELRGSFFTHFLASGMRGDADTTSDGRVSLYELYQYAYNKTLERSYRTGGREQHPAFDYAMQGSGQVVVSYPEQGDSRLILPAELEGNFLVYSPERDAVLAEISKPAGQARSLVVPAGALELFKRTDEALYRTTLVVAAGEKKTVTGAEMKEVSRTYLIEKGAAAEVVLGAKGGYQFFWDATIRSRSLLPSVLGGVELRIENLLPHYMVPYAEVLVGGGVASDRGPSDHPLAQSFSLLEAGTGVSFRILESPVLLELVPEVSLMYLQRTVESPLEAGPVDDTYLGAAPCASILLGRELFHAVSLGVQLKSGYLYFREDGVGKHLGFSEIYLAALWRL